MRKRHTSAFKAKIVAQALKEEKTLTQIASENDIHPNQISAWKATALSGLPTLFERESKVAHDQAAAPVVDNLPHTNPQIQRDRKAKRVESRADIADRSRDPDVARHGPRGLAREPRIRCTLHTRSAPGVRLRSRMRGDRCSLAAHQSA